MSIDQLPDGRWRVTWTDQDGYVAGRTFDSFQAAQLWAECRAEDDHRDAHQD